jgi:hypothetical protein
MTNTTQHVSGEVELLSQVDSLIDSFESKRLRLRKNDRAVFLFQAALAVSTTILTGLHSANYEAVLKNAALFASALATFAVLISGRFAFREQWIAYTETSSRLHALRSKLRLLAALVGAGQRPALTPEEIIGLHTELQNILNDADKGWVKTVSSQAKTQTGSAPSA